MGSRSSKWLATVLAVTASVAVPAAAGAKLDYSRNSVDGQYLPSPARLVPQINDVPTASSPAPSTVVVPAAPARAVVRVAQADSGFSWGDAFAGAGIALLLAFAGMAIVRRHHPSALAG